MPVLMPAAQALGCPFIAPATEHYPESRVRAELPKDESFE